jgi:putrescine transport system substrate-binding protein
MTLTMSRLAAAVLLACAAVFPAKAEEPVLNVYNWSDYVAKDTLERFTKETGIKVNYDVYDSNEVLDSKLMTGKSGYDVVFPSASPFFAQQVKAGVFQPLDKAKLPNAANLEKMVMATLTKSDPGNEYGLPYMMAATGIGYNVDKVKAILGDGAPIGSWKMLFHPETLAKLKACGVTLLDTPTEVVPAMQTYMKRNPLSDSQLDLEDAMAALSEVRGSYKYIHSSKYINDLANGNICVAHGYVGDLVQAKNRAKEAKKKQNIAIFIPQEGAEVNIDVMAIPKDAKHPDNAHKFINFLLRPDVIGDITNQTGYANAVPASVKHIMYEIKSDPVIYPPPEVQIKLFTLPVPPKDYDKARARAWTKFRTAKK